MKSVFLFIVLLLSFSTPGHAAGEAFLVPSYERLLERLEENVLAQFRQHDGQGAVVALIDNDRLLWCFGMGFGDAERRQPVDCDTRFQIGTASALFTTISALLLVEQGKLSLSTPVAKCSKTYRLRSRFDPVRLTVRDILRHHSGLPRYRINGKWISEYTKHQAAPLEVDAVNPPGHIFSTSDIAMTMLGDCITRIVGQPFESHVTEKIFRPLGMNNTHYVTSAFKADLASGYKQGKVQPPVRDRDTIAAGVASTARDLAGFLISSIRGQHPVNNNIQTQMLTVQNGDVPLDLRTRIGYGWMLDAFDVGVDAMIAHYSGDSLFHRAQIVYLPEYKIGVVVLANHWKSRPMVDALAKEAITRLLVEKGLTEGRDARYPNDRILPARDFTPPTLGTYGSWKGKIDIVGSPGKYRMEIGGRVLHLIREPQGYAMQYRLLGIIPLPISALKGIFLKPYKAGGQKYVIANYRGSDFIWAESIRDSGITSSWHHRTGEYKILNQDQVQPIESMALEREDNLLVARFTVPGYIDGLARFPLKVVNDHEAVVAGKGNGLGEVVRVISDNPVRIVFSGFIAQRD